MNSIGKILLMGRGNYDPSVTYNILDWVRYDGSAWVCNKDGIIGKAPRTNPEWSLLVNDGSAIGDVNWTSIKNKPFVGVGQNGGILVDTNNNIIVDADNDTIYIDPTSKKLKAKTGAADWDTLDNKPFEEIAANGGLTKDTSDNLIVNVDGTTVFIDPTTKKISAAAGGGASSYNDLEDKPFDTLGTDFLKDTTDGNKLKLASSVTSKLSAIDNGKIPCRIITVESTEASTMAELAQVLFVTRKSEHTVKDSDFYKLFVMWSGHDYLYMDIMCISSYSSTYNGKYVLFSSNDEYTFTFNTTDGFKTTNITEELANIDEWHKYSGSVEIKTVSTANTSTNIAFHGLDTTKAYDLYFETSDGSMPTIESSSLSGTTLTYSVKVATVPANFKLRVIK